jgi:hypothetical protein
MNSRLLKKAHLRRWPTSALAATYLQYVSLGLRRAALHLGLLEQPDPRAAWQSIGQLVNAAVGEEDTG